MLYISVEDFLTKASSIKRMPKEEEKNLAKRLTEGDVTARNLLVNSYLPTVASYIRRAPRRIRSLRTVYACIASLEKGVDTFNFLQDGEPFAHHLAWRLRQCITRCLADDIAK